jgi:hypothetical protein
MSKVTIRQWQAPIPDEDLDNAASAANMPANIPFKVNILEHEPQLMQGTESNHPLVINPSYTDGPVVLSPQPKVQASNYFHENKLAWVASYEGNVIIKQSDTELASEKLSRDGLRSVCLVDSADKSYAKCSLEPGDIFFYRRRTALRPGDDVVEVIHILGKTKSEDGPNEVIFFYESDFHVEVGDFIKRGERLNEWRYPINMLEQELVPVR